MEWMLMPYRRYADFQGRSCRREYWMFTFFTVIVGFLVVTLSFASGNFANGGNVQGGTLSWGVMVVLVAWVIATIIPSIAVQVRRFHDQDRSGWMVLLGFIPYVGGLIVIIFMCLAGTSGPNRFGPDPLDPSDIDVFT